MPRGRFQSQNENPDTAPMSTHDAVLDTSASAATGLRECLIARVGQTRVAVPLDRIETVLEGSVGAEPPCDEPWVAGWFVHRDRLWLVVRLEGRRARPGANAKRIVIRESEGVRFAIEVDEVYGPAVLDHVADETIEVRGWLTPGGWLRRGAAYDGSPVCCVDVRAVAQRLALSGR